VTDHVGGHTDPVAEWQEDPVARDLETRRREAALAGQRDIAIDLNNQLIRHQNNPSHGTFSPFITEPADPLYPGDPGSREQIVKMACPCTGLPAQRFAWECDQCGKHHAARGLHRITHLPTGQTEDCGGPGACSLCDEGKPAGSWIQMTTILGTYPPGHALGPSLGLSATVEDNTPSLVYEQHTLTVERLTSITPGDPITLVTGGRITNHRVVAVDPDSGTVTLGDFPDTGPQLSYSGSEIHDPVWDGDEWWRERPDT
jgi:hypothetical protein